MAANTSVDETSNVMETRMETDTSKGGEEEKPMEQETGNTQHGQNSGGAPPGYWKEGKDRKDPEIGSEGGNSSRHGCLSSCRKWCNKLCQFFDCFKYSIVPAESEENMELGEPQPNQNPLKSPDQERPSHSAAYDQVRLDTYKGGLTAFFSLLQPTQQFYQPRFRLPDRPSWWSTQDTRRYREGYQVSII